MSDSKITLDVFFADTESQFLLNAIQAAITFYRDNQKSVATINGKASPKRAHESAPPELKMISRQS